MFKQSFLYTQLTLPPHLYTVTHDV